ncbi:response regulator [bacterium]|nr:response regulator [bacterium]
MTPSREILLVDDEYAIVEMIETVLRFEGFTVRSVFNGTDALNEVIRKKPDLIVLDLMMPGLNGFELCKELKTRREFNHIPIIMLTAKKDHDARVAGLMVGANDYLTKPFEIQELIDMIIRQLDLAKHMREEDGITFHARFEIKPDYAFMTQVNELIMRIFQQTALTETEIAEFEYCLNEALTNAIEHGSQFDPNKIIHLSYTLCKDKLVITIEDEGQGFNFRNLPDPTTDENIFNTRGRGIFIIKQYMDLVEYNEKGTSITLTKYLQQ